MNARANLRNTSTYLGPVLEEGLLNTSMNGIVGSCNDLHGFVIERFAESDKLGP